MNGQSCLNKDKDDWCCSGTQWKCSILTRWVNNTKQDEYKRKRSFQSTDWNVKRERSIRHFCHSYHCLRSEMNGGGGFISLLAFFNTVIIIAFDIGEIHGNVSESMSLRNCSDRAIRQFLPKNGPVPHYFPLQYISSPIICNFSITSDTLSSNLACNKVEFLIFWNQQAT